MLTHVKQLFARGLLIQKMLAGKTKLHQGKGANFISLVLCFLEYISLFCQNIYSTWKFFYCIFQLIRKLVVRAHGLPPWSREG